MRFRPARLRFRPAHLVAAIVTASGFLVPLAVTGTNTAAASASPTTYLAGTPQLATITDGTSQAPWNEFQGDGSVAPNESVLPTYTPSGGSTDVDGYPNLAVVPAATSTDSSTPYPSGTVGTPGPLDGYCGSGNLATEDAGTPALQPVGTTLPLAPAYFPHIVRNSDGSLTGYFDYRPKDANEEIVVAKSTDSGKDWTYEGEALEQNPGYCPSSDTNDDGEGHPNVITVGGNSYLYTLPRAAGDNVGVGMLVHELSPTAADPLNGAPTVESSGIDPDDIASVGVTVPATGNTGVTISLSDPIGTGPEGLVVGNFVDATATPSANASEMIDCTGVGAQSLTGCTSTGSSPITVSTNDLIDQVIGTASSSATVPQGPNTETGDGGLSSLTLNVTNPNNLTMALFNNNAPGRLYIDGATVYCAQSNADPTTEIENCTTTKSGGLSVASGDPVTADPIVPATAQQTTGLVAPDGIVGVLPSFPDAPGGSTVIMYTEKVINYFDIGYMGASTFSALGTNGSATVAYTDFWNTASAPAGSAGSYSFTIGDDTTDQPVTFTCTGQTTTSTGGSFTGCSYPSSVAGSDSISKKTYLVAPGGSTSTSATSGEIGEGSPTDAQKMFKDNEDLSLLRVAYTTNGVTFSDAGLPNDGIVSGTGSDAAVNGTTGAVTCTTANEAPPTGYSDINDPCSTTSPSNLNAYAGDDSANGTAGASGGTDTNGTALTDEMRWVGSAGSIITNPDGTYGLFLSGAWQNDGDSDAFNQIFYSTSTNGENWSVPTSVISTDYSFAASSYQDANPTTALGISAYYEGRAYGPTVVQNPNGTLTMLFAGDRFPKSAEDAGTVLGTNSSDQYTVGADDPLLYRNILVDTLTPAESSSGPSSTTVSASTSMPSVGSSDTLSATVASSVDPNLTPSGTVTFSDAGGTLCTATLNGDSPDVASCAATFTTAGNTPVTATYSGDDTFAGSTGNLTIDVQAGFNPGDLVVAVDQQSATGNLVDPVDLADYSTAGTPSGFSVALPTAASGNNEPLVDYGGYENGGLLTDSGDGGNLDVAGYEPSAATVIGATAPGTDHASPDVVGIVGKTGDIDTSTVLNDGTAGTEYTHYDRSATTDLSGSSAAGGAVYLSGSQAIDELTQGSTATSDNFLQTAGTDNTYDLQIVNGNLYASGSADAACADGGIWQVGSGLPTSGTETDTPLICGAPASGGVVQNAEDTTHFSPEQFYMLNAGTGGAVSTIYVADSYSKAGASGTNGAVEKYTCTTGCGVSSGWTYEGYVALAYPTGLTAKETSSGVEIFATGGNNGGAAANQLYEITDPSCSSTSSTTACATTALSGSATSIATAPSDDEFHGVAWAPTASAVPNSTPILPSQATLVLTSISGTALSPLTLTTSGGSGTGAVTYAVTSAGTADCSITGGGTTVTATNAGTCTVTATKASDGINAATSSAATTITFAPSSSVAITSTASTTLTTGIAGTFTVTTTGTPTPALSESGTLPTGVTFTDNGNGTATLAGTTSVAAGTYFFTINATNGSGTPAAQNFTLTILGSSPTPTTADLTGAVTNGSGTTLSNICVYLYTPGNTSGAAYATCTAANGSYELDGVTPGNYDVAFADPTGTYQTQWYNATTSGASTESSATPVTLAAGAATTDIDAAMSTVSIGNLTGTVTNGSGTALSNICAYLYQPGDSTGASYATCTAANGTYAFSGITPGSYDVAFADPTGTYTTQWYNATTSGASTQSGATPVTVPGGNQTLSGIDATMSTVSVGNVTGTVTAASGGGGLSNICVYLYTPGNTSGAAYATCTAANGTYAFPDITSGVYDVAFADPTGTYQTQWYNATTSGASTQSGATTITVPAGNRTLSGIDAAMSTVSIGNLTGTVTNGSGTALSNICAYLYQPGDSTGASYATCTAANGTYAFSGITPGSYDVAFADPTGTYTTQWYNATTSGASTQSGATPVTVPGGNQTLSGIDATMAEVAPAAGNVTGTVTAASGGGGLSNICVYLYQPGDSTAASYATCTGSSGAYGFSGVTPGSYDVAFSDPTGTYQTLWYAGSGSGAPTQSGATPITVVANATESGINAALTEVAVGNLSGTVTNGSATPLSNICVYLYQPGNSSAASYATCTGSNGEYEITGVIPGNYDVAFYDPSFVYATQWYDGSTGGSPTQSGATPVAVPAGNKTLSGINATLTAIS